MSRKIDANLIDKLMDSWIHLSKLEDTEKFDEVKINPDIEETIEIDRKTLLQEHWKIPNHIEEEMSRVWGVDLTSSLDTSLDELRAK